MKNWIVCLGRFYVKLRNNKGEMYRKTTLLSYRQGIQRFLQSIRPDVDIIKVPLFRGSNKCFKGMTMELKRQGQANIDHHPPISDADLIKMYDYLSSSDSAQVLQHKISFKTDNSKWSYYRSQAFII